MQIPYVYMNVIVCKQRGQLQKKKSINDTITQDTHTYI